MKLHPKHVNKRKSLNSHVAISFEQFESLNFLWALMKFDVFHSENQEQNIQRKCERNKPTMRHIRFSLRETLVRVGPFVYECTVTFSANLCISIKVVKQIKIAQIRVNRFDNCG